MHKNILMQLLPIESYKCKKTMCQMSNVNVIKGKDAILLATEKYPIFFTVDQTYIHRL